MQGGNEDELQDLRQEVEQADRVAKQAGGASESKLRLETMDQARKNARKRAAIQRARSALEAACQKRDQAVAEVEAAKERLGVLEAELEQGRARHAYLAAQHAAETRPPYEVQAVQSALAALRMAGGALPPELQQQQGVLDQAISMFYPRGNEVEEALAQAGLGGDSDTELSALGSGSDTDDEPEVSAELLWEHRDARKSQKAIWGERKADFIASIASGKETVRDIASRYAERAKQAADRCRLASEGLEAARTAARARKQAEKEAREAQASTRAQRASSSSGADRVDDDEVVPCPPPRKMWRCDQEETCSDVTIDETPVITTADAVRGRGRVGTAGASEAATVHQAATAPPEAPPEASSSTSSTSGQPQSSRQRQAQVEGGQQQPEVSASANSSPFETLVADCATKAVQAAANARVVSAERSRRQQQQREQQQQHKGSAKSALVGLMATRWGRPRAASHDARMEAEERRKGLHAPEDRSKSPRRAPRTPAAMEQC